MRRVGHVDIAVGSPPSEEDAGIPTIACVTATVELASPSSPDGKEVITPATRSEWRLWLDANQRRDDGLWIVFRKKSSDLIGPDYEDLVEEALCFGWIDSKARRVDDHRIIQWFSPRRKGGMWSASNKARVERLSRQGLITTAGLAVIEEAKADGSWFESDNVEMLLLPDDLGAALASAPEAEAAYQGLTDSAKKQYLWWIASAKRPETRSARIAEAIRRLIS